MVSLLFWMLVIQLGFVRGRKLRCPHCQAHGISASKVLHVGPLWSLRCTHCQRKCKVTFWLLPLNVMTALAVGFFVLNSYIKVNDRLLDISPMLAIPAVLMLDLCLRFYVFKLQKK